MKKIRIIGLIALCFLLFLPTGCSVGRHKITIKGDERNIVKCPKYAKAGETVVVETVSVCDADLYFYVDGIPQDPARYGYYEFVMPDHDVSVECDVVANGLA